MANRKSSPMRKIPASVAKRILSRCAANVPVVVTSKRGVPSRVYGLEEYEKMREHPKNHKPWKRRTAAIEHAPDPLGAVHGTVRTRLTREAIYSEDRD